LADGFVAPMNHYPVTVITGASGWVGRSTMAMLSRQYPRNLDFVHPYSSSAREITNSTGKLFQTKVMETITDFSADTDFFVPLAFLNQDQIALRGETEFAQVNRHIIQVSEDFIRRVCPKKVILISSGVVNLKNLDTTPSYSLYRSLKLEQELRLTEACKQSSSKILICRLYSISGSEMTNPKNYALGEFILSALSDKKIVIRSGGKVRRKYLDIESIMELLFRMHLHSECTILNSSGFMTDLEQLATLVVSTLNSKSDIYSENVQAESPMSEYFWPGSEMEQVADREGISFKGLAEQIAKTAMGIRDSHLQQ
jgi:nucleoside-diphosphate-sugar epimerase